MILKGGDCFVKARTGTGKTLAFLIPAIEVSLPYPPCYSYDSTVQYGIVQCSTVQYSREHFNAF